LSYPYIEHNKELVIRLIGGDEEAFTTIFHLYKQQLFNIGWAYTRDPKLAEDIVQDAFVLLWNNREKLGHVEDIGSYLKGIARNRSIRILQNLESVRRKTDLLSQIHASYQLDHTEDLSENTLKAYLREALTYLSPQQRTIFELNQIQGLSRTTIAEKLEISKSTVGVHLSIAIRRVRAFLIRRVNLGVILCLIQFFLKKN
jgi:RNA polymerase sigma-70 factor (ECF subfamily)